MNRLLGEILVELNYLTAEKLGSVLEEQELFENEQMLLGEILVDKGLITDRELNHALQISLKEVLESSESDHLIRESTLGSLAFLERQFEESGADLLSEEGKLALLIRLEEYRSRIERLKRSIKKSLSLKMTKFRKMAIQSSKNQLIELQIKIKKLEVDVKRFCE